MSQKNPSLLYDPKVRSIAAQLVVVGVLIYFAVNAALNFYDNYGAMDFKFWDRNTGVGVNTTFGTWLWDYESDSNIFTAYLVAISNTVILSFLGITVATIIGFIMGVFRLSKNFVLKGASTLYVEILRNIPLLLQIFFWIAMVRTLSSSNKIEDAMVIIPNMLYLNADGLRFPYLDWQAGSGYVFLAAVLGIVIAWLLGKWSTARKMNTGKDFPSFWVGLAFILCLPIITFFIMKMPVIVEFPTEITEGSVLKRGRWEMSYGGIITPEFIALFLALSIYTSAFIAEIVRSGIQSVSNGQTEAANALGLTSTQTLNKVVIPQALRVIIPPLTSQYLNLTKNTSLAAAIGYPELTALFAGVVLNQIGKAPEIILVTIATYLTFSILTSVFMNWYNARKKLVER